MGRRASEIRPSLHAPVSQHPLVDMAEGYGKPTTADGHTLLRGIEAEDAILDTRRDVPWHVRRPASDRVWHSSDRGRPGGNAVVQRTSPNSIGPFCTRDEGPHIGRRGWAAHRMCRMYQGDQVWRSRVVEGGGLRC